MTKIFKLLSLLLVILFPFTSCTEDPEDSTGSISGIVTQAPNGTEPLSGVTVSINTTGQSTTTGSDGAYIFTDVQPGSYSLQFSKSGYTTNSRSVTVVAGNNNKCDIQLSKVNEEAEILINPSSLNFGTTQTDMSVTIKNNGNATASWSIELGNNPWLSASQLGGSIQAGRTQSITFTVDRNYLSETRTIVVNLQAFGNSYPITISCAPRNTTSYMVIEPTSLNFGSETSQQTFTIRNTGTSTLSWSVSGLSTEGLSLSATQGTVSGGGSSVVITSIDREIIKNELVTTFIVTDGVKDQTITVNINKGSGGSSDDPDDPENPGGDDDPDKFVVTNGLTAYYLFNDNFDDAVGELDGFGIKDPEFVTGITKKAVKFSKTKENSVQIPYGLVNSTSFSICFWAKGLGDGLIYTSKGSDNNYRFTLSMYNGDLKFICSSYYNGSLSYYKDEDLTFSHSSISTDDWHHIAIVSDFGSTQSHYWTSTLYIDGKRCGSISEYSSTSETQYPNAFLIGGKVNFYNYSLVCPNFTMDDLRIYDSRILSADEIKEIFKAKQ